jgi:hypothetical protein
VSATSTRPPRISAARSWPASTGGTTFSTRTRASVSASVAASWCASGSSVGSALPSGSTATPRSFGALAGSSSIVVVPGVRGSPSPVSMPADSPLLATPRSFSIASNTCAASGRSRRSTVSIERSSSATASGTSGSASRRSGGGCVSRAMAIEIGLSPAKGGCAVSSSNSTAPRAYMSVRPSGVSPMSCSGAMYAGVPISPPTVRAAPRWAVARSSESPGSSAARAMPKSVITTRSCPVRGPLALAPASSTLSGLRSR